MLDLAIIGGGPAGCAAALEARRHGLRVAVWDRDRFPRHKVCGEFISPEALPWLAQAVPGILAGGAAMRHAEFIAQSGLRRGFKLPQAAKGLSRYILDAALWRAAERAGVETHGAEGIRSVRKSRTAWKAEAWELENSEGQIAMARALIIACGRWWRVEGLPSPGSQRRAAGEWVGAKAHFDALEPCGGVEMYLFRGGYCGLAPIENGLHNVCCLVHRERLRKAGLSGVEDLAHWLGRVAGHAELAARLRGGTQASAAITTAPVRLARRAAEQNGALLAGDASGFLDPFTGEGISMALHSGRLAASAIAGLLDGRMSSERAVETYRQILESAVKQSYRFASLARALMSAPAWVQNLSAASLPWLGSWLLRETRWRAEPLPESS